MRVAYSLYVALLAAMALNFLIGSFAIGCTSDGLIDPSGTKSWIGSFTEAFASYNRNLPIAVAVFVAEPGNAANCSSLLARYAFTVDTILVVIFWFGIFGLRKTIRQEYRKALKTLQDNASFGAFPNSMPVSAPSKASSSSTTGHAGAWWAIFALSAYLFFVAFLPEGWTGAPFSRISPAKWSAAIDCVYAAALAWCPVEIFMHPKRTSSA